MDGEKFTNYPLTIKALLGLIEANDIAIPEIQRPFLWKNTQVRDLIDSLYKGYPTGYIILWKNPNVKLKDGQRFIGYKNGLEINREIAEKETCQSTTSKQEPAA